jgi:hypothetical protein
VSSDAPTLGEVIVNTQDDWLDLPDPQAPYYVLAKEGMFLHKHTAQGRGLIKVDKAPARLKPVGFDTGYFRFSGPAIPATIYAQAVSFFRRIFENHHTEAEVIITQHKTTGEYRLFVPTQRVNHGGVYSIYNPAHIDRDYLTIGTFHSHCDFNPGHSSTDEGDARDMDGLHGTIGFVTRDVPEMALMYALNGKFFHFKMPFDGVVDMTDLTAAAAPPWWDRYVILTNVTDADRQRIAPYADDETWDRFMGRRKNKGIVVTKVISQPGPTGYAMHTPPQLYPGNKPSIGERTLTHEERESLRRYYAKHPESEWAAALLNESKAFNARDRGNYDDLTDNQLSDADRAADAADEQMGWEEFLGEEYVTSLFETGLMTEEDVDMAWDNWPESADTRYWEDIFRSKLLHAVVWLRHQGLTVKVELDDRRPVVAEGQTTLDEHIGGLL